MNVKDLLSSRIWIYTFSYSWFVSDILGGMRTNNGRQYSCVSNNFGIFLRLWWWRFWLQHVVIFLKNQMFCFVLYHLVCWIKRFLNWKKVLFLLQSLIRLWSDIGFQFCDAKSALNAITTHQVHIRLIPHAVHILNLLSAQKPF